MSILIRIISMAGQGDDSSERSVGGDIFETSSEGPISTDLSITLCQTLGSGLDVPLPILNTEFDAPGSKWKPLVGTPSKPPLPENIFVPDPPPSYNSSDDVASSAVSSSSSSSVNQRRQGEYVQRPPVWKVYKMEDGFAYSQEEEDDLQLEMGNGIRDLEYSLNYGKMDLGKGQLDSQNVGWTQFAESVDKQITKMADVFVDRPLIVNMMQNSDLPLLPSTRYVPPSAPPAQRPSPPKITFNDDILAWSADVEARENNNPQRTASNSLEITQAPLSEKAKGKQKEGAQDVPDKKVVRFQRIKTSHSIGTNTNRSSQNQGNSDSSHCDSHPESDTPKIFNIGLDPKRYCHFEFPNSVNNGDFIDSYVDIRVPPPLDGYKPLPNSIVRGSHVIFIGRTDFDNANGRPCEIGLPILSQFFVERIFGDYWALCLKLQPGLEIATKKNRSLGGIRKLKPPSHLRMGPPLVPVKNHPVIVVYAPLCALTLVSNYSGFQPHMRVPNAPQARSTASEGGLVKAAPRSSSDRFEADAQRSRVVWVSEKVYHQYKDFCDTYSGSLGVLGREVPTVQDVAALGNNNPPEKTAGKPEQGKVTSHHSIAQRYKGLFGRKKHQAAVDVPFHPIDEPTENPNPTFFDANPSQQENQGIPLSTPLIVELPNTTSGDPDDNPFLSASADADPRSGSVESMITNEWAGEDNVPGGVAHPGQGHTEIGSRQDDTSPGLNNMQAPPTYLDINFGSSIIDVGEPGDDPFRNPSDPENPFINPSGTNSDQARSASPVPTESKKGEGKKKVRKSIGSRLRRRAWRTTNEKRITAPLPQGPGSSSLRACLNYTFKSLIKPRRQARPSVLPQNSDKSSQLSDDKSSEGPIVFDPGWDAERRNEGSRSKRFNKAWQSFKAKRVTNPPKPPNPFGITDENRQHIIEMESQNHSLELQNLSRVAAAASEPVSPAKDLQLETDGASSPPDPSSAPAPPVACPVAISACEDDDGAYIKYMRKHLLTSQRAKSERASNAQVNSESSSTRRRARTK